jgi:hypothetical protein
MASVADLVGPLVGRPDGVPSDVRESAARLHDAGAITLDDFGPLRVTASVVDDDGPHQVELASTVEGLASDCDCTVGATGLLCPHSLATAIVTWERAPHRRA